MDRIYLDNNATTALAPEVREAMLPFLAGEPGNPSSMHGEGRHARRALETARDTIAGLLDAEPDQVLFTSGGTEANNLAIFGSARKAPGHCLTSSVEHPSVLDCFDRLQRMGYEQERLEITRNGLVRTGQVSARIRGDTRLVAVMLVNNETGTVQPVPQLAAEAGGIPFHCDAVQGVGRMPVSFRELGVTSLSLSAHKFHGPVGIGALIAQRQLLTPVLCGGHQEHGIRPGTEPVALVVAMAEALRTAVAAMESDRIRVARLRDRFELHLLEAVPDIAVNGSGAERAPNTSNVLFAGIDAQATVMACDLNGLACSTGSACASGAPEPSHVLLAMGLTQAQARASIRFSLSRFTTQREVDRAAEIVIRAVRQQRSIPTHRGG